MKSYCYIIVLLLTSVSLNAQGFSGGFKAGLNFSTFSADAETDADGNTLETFKSSTGFHVGATFSYAFTDLFGLKADLMYSQKGVDRSFEGPSYFHVYTDTQTFRNRGDLKNQQSVVNSYIDIPVMAYYRIGPVEVAGGASAGFLVSSTGAGSAKYTNTPFGNDTEVVFSYETNYFRDEAGAGSILSLNSEPITTGGLRLPNIIGAYYNSESDKALYKRLDLGLVAEVNFFLNNGLFVGVRYQHGLSDVTEQSNDQQLYLQSPTDDIVVRDDKDYNRSIQASIGFRF